MHEYPSTWAAGEGEEKPFGQAGQKWYAWSPPLNILLTFFDKGMYHHTSRTIFSLCTTANK